MKWDFNTPEEEKLYKCIPHISNILEFGVIIVKLIDSKKKS